MRKIIILQGLQASGKSSFAKELIKKDSTFKRINRDLLREMIDAGQWSEKKEKYIRQAEINLAKMYVEAGFNIIVDDTNLSDSAKNLWENFAKENKLKIEYKLFDTPLEECIRRDNARANGVGESVIKATYYKYLAPAPAVYTPPKNKPKAILVDMDGTLAHMNGKRGPFEWHNVGVDDPDFAVWDVLVAYNSRRIHGEWVELIIFSGRDSESHEKTEEWLSTFDIPYDQMFMRSKGDMRPDEIVKAEMFDKYIKDEYEVLFIIDDRPKVCRMWRSKGIKVFQVGDPAREF